MKAKLLITLFCAFVLPGISSAIPTITNPMISSNTVMKYDKVEIFFEMNNYSNPYNPDLINSYVEFWSPTNKYYKVDAFYFEDYNKSDYSCWGGTILCEKLVKSGLKNWKVRFTPNETGQWLFRITSIDNSGRLTLPSTSQYYGFACVNSSKKGFVEKANNRFLKYSSGDFYFPVGESLAWHHSDWFGPNNLGTNEYKAWIDSLAKNNVNFARIWLDNLLCFSLIGKDYSDVPYTSYFDQYNQKASWKLDWIFEYARAKGINIMLCFYVHSSWGDSTNWTEHNLFNISKGGPISTPYQFFTNRIAIQKTKNLIKYINSRWGYATNLMAWELWNEVENVQYFALPYPIPATFYKDVSTWHKEISTYLKSIDPYKHLITTSYGNLTQVHSNNIESYKAMDFSQAHLYLNSWNALKEDDLQKLYYSTAVNHTTTLNKPFIIGESGWWDVDSMNIYDPKGLELHNSLWASAFTTSLGSTVYWFWINYIDPQNLYYHFKPVGPFMNALPVPSDSFNPYQIYNVNGLRSYYMGNARMDTVYGWVQDMNFSFNYLWATTNGKQYLKSLNPSFKPNRASSNNKMIISMPNRKGHQYKVYWYSAETGSYVSQTTTLVNANNQLILEIPLSLRKSTYGDAVFKVFLDCNQYVWREREISTDAPKNVSGNVICNKNNGQVYYKTPDNKIHSMWWNQSSNCWQWTKLGEFANNVAGDLAITKDGKRIFYRTTDNKVQSLWWDSSIGNWRWDNLNNAGTNVKGPIVITENGQAIYRNINNMLNMVWWNLSANKWEWSGLNNASLGGVGDAMVIGQDGAYYKTLNTNKIYAIIWNQSQSKWVFSNLNNAANNVGGSLTVNPNNQVFYQTTDNKINNIWRDGSGNWQWSGLNNSTVNVAGDLMSDNSAGNIYYRNTSNNIYCIYWQNGVWYNTMLDNATKNNAAPGNIAIDNLGNVFFRGTDNQIHHLYYKSVCFDTPAGNFQRSMQHPESTIVSEALTAYTPIQFELNEISVYPNPANEKVFLKSPHQIKQYEMYDMYGRMIKQQTELNENEVGIDVLNFIEGVYLLRISMENGLIHNQKILIRH